MREAHRLAARHLYDVRNASHGSNGDDETFVDLHGLHPAEAISYLDAALKKQRTAGALQREGDRSAIVYAIVGTGHHSKGGRDKVGKAIRGFLNDCTYAFREFSVVGSAGGGGAGGIVGIDATSGSTAAVMLGKDDGDDGEALSGSPATQHGKIRILKAEDVKGGGDR